MPIGSAMIFAFGALGPSWRGNDSGGGLRRAFAPAFRADGMVLFIPWRVGAEEAGAAKYGFGGAMLLDRLGLLNKSKSGFRFIDFRAPR